MRTVTCGMVESSVCFQNSFECKYNRRARRCGTVAWRCAAPHTHPGGHARRQALSLEAWHDREDFFRGVSFLSHRCIKSSCEIKSSRSSAQHKSDMSHVCRLPEVFCGGGQAAEQRAALVGEEL